MSVEPTQPPLLPPETVSCTSSTECGHGEPSDYTLKSSLEIALVAHRGQGREFRLPTALLSSHSAFFADMFAISTPRASSSTDETSVHHIPVEESNTTIEIICLVLRGEVSHTTDFGGEDDVADLAYAGEKYKMANVVSAARQAAMSEIHHPLWQFALAARFGWRDLVCEAAERTLEHDLEDHLTPDVTRHLDAAHLVKLLEYRRAYADAFIDCINDMNGPFRQENEARCPKRHRPDRTAQRTHDITWPFLKRSMTAAVLRRPSGASVLRDMQAVNAVKKAVCPHDHLIYPNWDLVEKRIRNCFAKGPPASTYFK